MSEFNFLIPVVCNDFARVKLDIPEELIPKFKKFLTSNTQISWINIEKFLRENDLENDSEGVHVGDKINESCQEFDPSALYWEAHDFAAVDFENENHEEINLEQEWTLRALTEIRESGDINMHDRQSVVQMIALNGWEDEADFLEVLTDEQYFELLQELPEWLEIEI